MQRPVVADREATPLTSHQGKFARETSARAFCTTITFEGAYIFKIGNNNFIVKLKWVKTVTKINRNIPSF